VRSLYSFDQGAEAVRRTRRILDRIERRVETPHGFYDPHGFMLANIIRSEQVAKAKQIIRRISDKIKRRDAALTVAEIAARMDEGN